VELTEEPPAIGGRVWTAKNGNLPGSKGKHNPGDMENLKTNCVHGPGLEVRKGVSSRLSGHEALGHCRSRVECFLFTPSKILLKHRRKRQEITLDCLQGWGEWRWVRARGISLVDCIKKSEKGV
jgi:hypothetical protein